MGYNVLESFNMAPYIRIGLSRKFEGANEFFIDLFLIASYFAIEFFIHQN